MFDEVNLELELELPDIYPLKRMEIRSKQRKGISEEVWASWMAKMQASVFQQDCTVWNALELWHGNLQRHFDGAEVYFRVIAERFCF